MLMSRHCFSEDSEAVAHENEVRRKSRALLFRAKKDRLVRVPVLSLPHEILQQFDLLAIVQSF